MTSDPIEPTPWRESADGADEKLDVLHVEASTGDPTFKTESWTMIKEEADAAVAWEKRLSLWQSFKVYRAAVAWSLIASLSIIMEGYDTALAGAFWSMPQFQQRFGTYSAHTKHNVIPAGWQVAIGLGATIGTFVGIPYGAWLVDRYGYRKTLMLNYVIITPLIAITTFAQNLEMLLIGGILCGIPWGVFSTLPAAYASEVCPVHLRAYLTGWVNTCWVLGGFLATGVLNGTVSLSSQWAYRAPYATQWVWPVPLCIALYFAPESPWWLVRHDRPLEAETQVRRLASDDMKEHAHETVAMMIRTNQLEIDNMAHRAHVSVKDCFLGTDLRRTLISCMAFMCQNLSGSPFAGNVIYFFTQAGINSTTSFRLGLGNSAILICANFLSFFAITHIGRRKLYITGLAIMLSMMIVIAGLAFSADSNAKWATAAVIYIWNIAHASCLGPTAYAIVSETSSTRLRNKTVGMSRWMYQLVAVVGGIVNPYMLNPTALNWKGKTAFFWIPPCAGCLVWAIFCLPEFKGRSYYEIDILFERKVKASKFASTIVDADADDQQRRDQDTSPPVAQH